MSKQYIDVSGWNTAPSAEKHYVDVSGWDSPSKPEPKGMIERVVDSVAAPFKAVAAAYEKDQEPKPTKPITATEKLALARPMFEMGRRSEAYMKNLEHEAQLEQGQIKREEQGKKRNAQIAESKKPALQQLSDQFNPMRPITAIPQMIGTIVGGEETGKAIAKEFGGDYQYDSGKRDTTFSEANPDYVMAESVIVDPLNTLGAPIKAVGRAVNIAKIRQAKLANNPLHSAAQDIIDSSAKNLGIELPKAQAPEVIAKDEAIAKAMNEEHRVPKATEEAFDPKVDVGFQRESVENPPADFVDDTNIGHKVEIPTVNPIDEAAQAEAKKIEAAKLQAKAEQDARTQAAHEEAMARKAEYDAKLKEEADTVHKADMESIEANPRLQELIEMRRNVSAKESASPNSRVQDRQFIGDPINPQVVGAIDEKNWNHDFALTKADIKAYEKNGITPALAEKFKKDLDVLDNDPVWQKVDENPPADLGHVKGDKFIDENGVEEEIPFSKGIQPIEAHTIETMGESLTSSLGKPLSEKLSPIMTTINKADIPEAVIAKANRDIEGIHGFVHEGKAYIVADNIPKEWSEQQVRGLVMHEVGVHLRKVGVEDKEFGKVLNLLKDSKDHLVKEAYARVPKDTEAHLIDEEALAYLIQNHPDTTIARRAIAWVKQQLIRMGISPAMLKLTPKDLSAMAWGAVKRGDGSVISKETMFMAPLGKAGLKKEFVSPKGNLLKDKIKAKGEGFVPHVDYEDPISDAGKAKYQEVFGDGKIETPNGEVEVGFDQYKKLDPNFNDHGEDRRKFLGAIRPTLEQPQYIVEFEDVTMYLRFFHEKGNRDVLRFISVVRDTNGDLLMRSGHNVDRDSKLKMIFEHGDVIAERLPDGTYSRATASHALAPSGQPVRSGIVTPNNQVDKSIAQVTDKSQGIPFSRTETPQESAGGFYSAAQKAIEKMPNKMESEAFIKYLKNNGVKDDEITWSGISKAIEGKETITKDEIVGAFGNPVMEKKTLQEVDESDVASWWNDEGGANEETNFFDLSPKEKINAIEEYKSQVVEYGGSSGSEVKYQQYSLKDVGDNYREELTKITTEDDFKQWVEKYRHQDDPTWEEIKSSPELYKEYREAFSVEQPTKYKSSHWDEPNVLLHTRKQDTVIDGDKTLLVEEIQSDWHQAKRKGENVPDAPYQKTWHELGMRQIIDEAVTKGYERVAWVKGVTQVERYSLSKSVDRLVYNKDANIIQGFKDGEEVMYKNATENELESLIGKDPAKKLMESEVKTNIYEIKGEQLDIGGDGMKGFYDKILVDFARKYTKKWGVEVETKTLPNGVEVHSFPVNGKMKEDISKNGQALYANGAGVMAGIGEDENGDMTFDPLMALAGIAGVSAVMSKTVRASLSKLAGKTEHLSDSVIQGMVRVAIKSADKVTAGTITKAAETIKKSDLVDYVIGHKIYGMKDYMKLREDALRSANAGMESAARLHLQLKELSSEAREAMYGYMSGDKNIALTLELKRTADTFVTKIDDMGQQLVDEGILTKEAYTEWKGQYLHRKYASKMKRASDWASGRGEFGVDSIKMRGKTWSADAAEYQALEDAGMIGKVSDGKVEVLHEADGTYKLRRDWTPAERTDMGEIKDIAYSLPETVGRMAQMLHYSTMLKSIPKKYILAQEGRADVVMKGLGYEKLNSSRFGALNGKWVNQSIAGDLKRVSNDVMGEEANVRKLWNDYVTAVKMSHTVYNPTAHVNNIGSNVFLQAAAGLNPLKTIRYATQGTIAVRKYGRLKELDALRVTGLNSEDAAELAKLEGDVDVGLWKQLDEHRMFGRSQLNEILRSYMSPHIDTTSGSAMNKVSENVQALYQGEDDVMRFSAVKQLMNDGLWIDGAVSAMDLKTAMKYVNDTIVPDYSKPMSKLALTLRDSGLVPFMSWTYYSTPILLRQLRDHPTRVMGIAGAWMATDMLFGVNPYDEESMPKGFAQQRVAVGRDGDKVTGMRVSSMVPHVQLANPANTFLEPLTSGIPQTMLGSATNYNFYFRKPITQKDGAEGVYHRAKDAVMNVLPSPDILDKVYNLGESKVLDKETRRRDRVFEPRTTAQEAASFFVNLQTYDESAQKAHIRKDKIKEKKQSSKWDKKMDRAINKLFGGNL